MKLCNFVFGAYLILIASAFVASKTTTTQDIIDYIAQNLVIEVAVNNNLQKEEGHVPVDVKFYNAGNESILPGLWKIFFYNLYGVRAENLSCGLRVDEVNGGLFYFEPILNEFKELTQGTHIICTFYNKFWTVARTDFFLNWYLSSPGYIPKIIKSTREEGTFVKDFDTPAKWKRSKEDQWNPFSTEERYEMNESNDPKIRLHRIVPKPLVVKENQNETLAFDRKSWAVIHSDEFAFETHYLSDKLQLRKIKNKTRDRYIEIIKDNDGKKNDTEAYTLHISPELQTIRITASSPKGALHGVQSLISLIEGHDGPLHSVVITDKPRFSYRGVLLDTARNFKPKSWIFRFLDVMSMYKLNKLHFHLSNDEGWRIEIPKLPELTQIGGRRCHSDRADECLIPQLGSGPYSNNSGSGFYSVKDYRDILMYANERHIEVIPEIDMPAHSYAAISSMNAREIKVLSRNGINTSTESYLLSDQSGPSNVYSAQRWKRNAINPCLNSTYKFVEVLVDGLVELHRPVQPLQTFHIGGDEVPEGVWNDSAACQMYLENKNINTYQLQKMFIKRVSDIIADRGLNLALVGEAVYGKKPTRSEFFKNRNVFAYRWDTRGEILNTPSDFVDDGYKVVLMPATHVYFDITQEPDPEERGLFWSTRYIDEKKVFSFMPENLLANIEVDPMGNPIDKAKLCKESTCFNLSKSYNVIGIQACIWAELMRNEEQFHHMAFPRILVLAERAWHKAHWEDLDNTEHRDVQRGKDWSEFVQTIGYQELPRLENRGILYRIPPPGAKLDACVLKANALYPNHVIETSLDKGRTWVPFCDMTLQVGSHSVQLRTKSIALQRKSRSINLELIVDEEPISMSNRSTIGLMKCLRTVVLKSNHGFSQSTSFCHTDCTHC